MFYFYFIVDVGPNSEASGVQRKNPESSNKPVKGSKHF